MPKYDHQKIEKKWKKYWEDNRTYKTKEDKTKEKFYVLDMFPYPSGAGLHVGHPKGYIATDVIARMKMMQGYNVLHPMGWDAFGLPAENYAIKNKVHPSVATEKNVETFKKQLGLLGFTYDWDREVNTIDPKYYKWTQWAFIQMFKRGLAFESYEPINWCPECKTGLANEDLENGLCERCGSQVEQKPLRQWVLRITDYAEKLLVDLDTLKDWPESIREMQRNWIGKSEGALVNFEIKDVKEKLEVFTTRPDTLFGATYCVIAPEHELIQKLKEKIENWHEVQEYIDNAKKKTALERTELQKEKTGIELKGLKAINPVNDEELPIFIADYVLTGYGTGAIMAVPAHDERDFEFAKKYGLPIKFVIMPEGSFIDLNKPYTGDGMVVKSDFIEGLNVFEAKEKMIAWLEEKGLGKRKVQYKLRDWVFSRQRYWGEPIPLVKCEACANKKPKILLIHGLYGHSQENWFPWFKKEMENNGYEVLVPNLVNTEHPTLDEWIQQLSDLGIKSGDRLYVIGHSLGAPAACQFLLKNKLKVEKLILVAPTGAAQGQDNWDNLQKAGCDQESIRCIQEFNKDNIGLEELSKLINETKIYLSDNDPYIPMSVENNYAALNPKIRKFVGKGHFGASAGVFELPEIVNEFPEALNLGWVPVPENQLPLELPAVKNYEPTGTGESPLANITDWVNTTCPHCGGPAKRETNTMPQWAGSCWYYLRYEDPKNDKALVDKEKEKYWSPIDLYVGGAEHATRHLIYARFWHKFLYDIGVVNYPEPFTRLQNVGLILAEDGRKMSKRWGNVINPDDVVKEFGADAMRLYEMFMGPFDQSCAWSTNGVIGCRRFLEKVWYLQEKIGEKVETSPKLVTLIHQIVKKVGEDIPAMRYNTAIAKMMELVNELGKEEKITKDNYLLLIKILSPFAPHITEEIWSELGKKGSIFESDWPEYDEQLANDSEITLVVQVNGKVRDNLVVSPDISEDEAKKIALESDVVKKWLDGKEPKKVIYVKGKLVSIVV